METWSVHHLFKTARAALGRDRAAALQRYASVLIGNGIPVIFSLGHLSRITAVRYTLLHETVNRKRDAINYRMFAIRKRSGKRRFVHAVGSELLRVQHFINAVMLQQVPVHPAAYAFHRSGGIVCCAAQHCRARWLIQIDLADFFFSIPEYRVFHVFKDLGYRSLLAFELARLCTTTHLPKGVRRRRSGKGGRPIWEEDDEQHPPYLACPWVGVLPQGSPTSPMLSNCVARKLDDDLAAYATANGFVYTRYADDLAFSASELPAGKSVGRIRHDLIRIIRKNRFIENEEKIRIARPGAKKRVLGLLVDGEKPRLSHEMYRRIERHLYAVKKFGLQETAQHAGFESAFGFSNHLSGLIAFTKDVDMTRWKEFSPQFRQIPAP